MKPIYFNKYKLMENNYKIQYNLSRSHRNHIKSLNQKLKPISGITYYDIF